MQDNLGHTNIVVTQNVYGEATVSTLELHLLCCTPEGTPDRFSR